jgi:hypothetical protein
MQSAIVAVGFLQPLMNPYTGVAMGRPVPLHIACLGFINAHHHVVFKFQLDDPTPNLEHVVVAPC